MRVGDTVRYREPMDEAEKTARFVISELNGDRLFMTAICNLPFPPTTLAKTADVCKAEDQ
jgi:hypothetical protein